MTDPDDVPCRDLRRSLDRDVRRLARRERSAGTFWRSLSALGTVGWSIALPAAGGALLGHWFDGRYGTGVHATLALLVLGVGIGMALAWLAVRRRE